MLVKFERYKTVLTSILHNSGTTTIPSSLLKLNFTIRLTFESIGSTLHSTEGVRFTKYLGILVPNFTLHTPHLININIAI